MENKSKIAAKLLKFQSSVEAIKKDATNPFFKSKYFDVNTVLGVVKPLLTKCGLVVIQPLTYVETAEVTPVPAIQTTIIDSESGESISHVTVLPQNPDPQKFGSVITYFRRYSLVSMLALEGEVDDDGNSVSGKNVGIKEDEAF